LNASAEVDSGSVKAIVDGLKVKLNHIAFSEAGNDNPLLSLDALGLNDGHIDIGSRAITITQVEARRWNERGTRQRRADPAA
jgi:hypothetical protein